MQASHRSAGVASTSSRPHAPARPLGRCLRGKRALYSTSTVSVPVEQKQPDKEALQPLPRRVENAADEPTLANPLERAERMSTSWFGIIADYEGVVVEDTLPAHAQAWVRAAQDFDLPKPLGHTLARIKGVRDEQIIMQLFSWTRNPSMVAKIAKRKEEIYDEIMNGAQPAEAPHCRTFLETLRNYKIPIALATAAPERRVRPVLANLKMDGMFDTIITAEDNGTAETEFYYMAAANQLQRPFVRCIVVGDSNRSVEAAHELGMKSVVVTGGQPAWNFSSADLVVRSLSQLSFVNMKQLIGNEELIEREQMEPELQPASLEDTVPYSLLD